MVAILLTLSGCSGLPTNESTDKVLEDNTHKTNTVNEPSDKIDKPKSLDKKFIPPNFLVKEFKVIAHEEYMDIKLEYEINEALYKFLQNGPKFIFNIEFSEDIINETGIVKTDNVEGHVGNNGELNYEISFSTNLHKELDPSLLNLINNDEMDFRLIIYDEVMVPVHIFENVQWADTFQYGKSENVILEDD